MDTGLQCLSAMAMFHQLPVDINQLRHQFAIPNKSFETQDIIRAAKSLNLKAKSFQFNIDELNNSHLPAIIKTTSGHYLILAKLAFKDDRLEQLLIQDLRDTAPKAIGAEEFSNLWSGEIIVISRRASLQQSLQQKFDISWFIPSS